jgi:hypothetical protein
MYPDCWLNTLDPIQALLVLRVCTILLLYFRPLEWVRTTRCDFRPFGKCPGPWAMGHENWWYDTDREYQAIRFVQRSQASLRCTSRSKQCT